MKQLFAAAIGLALFLGGSPRACAQAFLEEGGWEYSHTSNHGNPCTFVIGNKDRRGSADYVWNGRRVKEQLEYVKMLRENNVSYLVYKVVNKDRWFVFALDPVQNNGKDDFRVFHAGRAPDKIGAGTLATSNVTSLRKLEKLGP